MASGSTSTYAFPYPVDSDPVDVAGDIRALALSLDSNIQEISQDAVALSLINGTYGNGLGTPVYNDVAGTVSWSLTQDLQTTATPTFTGVNLVGGDLYLGPSRTIVFEGSSDDGFETTFTVTNPTADRTITFQNATGTVAFTSEASMTSLLNIASATGAITLQMGYGATTNGTTKAINIGPNGVSGSITNINIGSSVAGALGTTTINSVTTSLAGDITIATGKAYQINGASVLNSTTLGSTVVSSSLTKIGTAAGLVVSDASGNLTVTANNTTNWDSAYSQRLQWDGGSTNLVAATGRTSLGATTVGSNIFTLTNPSAITFIKVNADNTVTTENAATHRTSMGATTVGANLFTLTNPSAITFPKINADNTVTAESAATHRTSLGATTVGSNMFTLANPSAISFPKINADNTITAESAATHRTSIGATTVGSNIFTLTNPSAISFIKINADNTITAESAATYKTSLALNNVENTALSTWAGSANITTVGTIATGIWSGTAIAVTKGGTGLTAGPTANGQLLIGSSGGTYTLATLTQGTGMTITNGAGTISLAVASVPNSHILKFDTGTTEGTDLYTFNGSAAKTVDIKAGTNITLTKAAGSITINSSASGSGTTTNPLALKFDSGTTEGTDLYTFNGSASKTINFVAGTNITLTKAAGSITIAATGSGSVNPEDVIAVSFFTMGA